MSRNYSIRHFIHHSDSEKVSYDNKLCQVYLMMSGRSDFVRTFTLQKVIFKLVIT